MTTTTTHETHERHETHATRDTHGRTWQDEYFTFVKRIEAPVLRTTTQLATRFADLVPGRPAFLAPMPKAHAVRDVMDTGFTFRKRMVEEQTMFARRMMKAIEPMLTTLDRVDTVPTKVPTTQPTKQSTKAPTKTPTSRTQRADRTKDHPAA
ncbi:MAG: hypothetical protein NTZ21_06690 [Actinobacteria bacterium]|nr:hypothetical protein [Actinomycetota bacterium]